MLGVPSSRGAPRASAWGGFLALAILAASVVPGCRALEYEQTLADGVESAAYVTARGEAKYFDFVLPAATDALVTVTMLDGDADLYVLGPNYHSRTPGPFLAGWMSEHGAGTHDEVYVSHLAGADAANGNGGTFQVGVVGWSSLGAGGTEGSEWTVRVDFFDGSSGYRSNTAAGQAAAMTAFFDACCAHSTDACKPWRQANTSDPRSANACRVRGFLCDASGAVTQMSLSYYGLECELSDALIAAWAPALATTTRLFLGGNVGLTAPQVSGGGAGALEALFLAAPVMTHFHAESMGSFGDGGASDTITDAVCAAVPTTLASLKLEGAGLVGEVPRDCFFARAADVRSVNLAGNALRGAAPSVPATLASLKLDRLVISHNAFNGTIPDAYATKAPHLVVFDVSENRLEGGVPGFGGRSNQPGLLSFSAGGNALTGAVPSTLFGEEAEHLDTLNVTDNRLTGALPADALAGARARVVSLALNAFTGAVPSSGASSKLIFASLARNSLTGDALPANVQTAPSLRYLYLEGNLLTGTLPSVTNSQIDLAKFKSLSRLNLAGNALSGSVPMDHQHLLMWKTWGSSSLPHLYDVSDNALTGPAPEWMARHRYRSDASFDIAGNAFECPIPIALQYLDLACVDPDASPDGPSDLPLRPDGGNGNGTTPGFPSSELVDLGEGDGGGSDGGDAGISRAARSALAAFGGTLFLSLVVARVVSGHLARRREAERRRAMAELEMTQAEFDALGAWATAEDIDWERDRRFGDGGEGGGARPSDGASAQSHAGHSSRGRGTSSSAVAPT